MYWFSSAKLEQDPNIFITENEARDPDTQIECNKSNYLLALLSLIQCKEEEDENIIEI